LFLPEAPAAKRAASPFDKRYLDSLLESTDRTAFDMATKKCPDLLDAESAPERFFEASNRQYRATAENLSNYWSHRLETFGEDRAFLPLTVTGDGALSKEVVAAMKCGAYTILRTDEYDRPVLLIDQAKFCPLCCEKTEIMTQTIFYLMNFLFSTSDQALSNGVVVVLAVDTSRFIEPNARTFKFLQEEIIPIKIRSIHFLVHRKTPQVAPIMTAWLNVFSKWKNSLGRYTVHYGECEKEFTSRVAIYGLSRNHLPKRLGGSIDSTSKFLNWCKDRVQEYEEKQSPSQAAVTLVEEEAEDPEQESKAGLAQQEEERRAKKRARDVLYQREKRQNEKKTLATCKEQVAGLNVLKEKLEDEYKMLERALVDAKKLAQDSETRKNPLQALLLAHAATQHVEIQPQHSTLATHDNGCIGDKSGSNEQEPQVLASQQQGFQQIDAQAIPGPIQIAREEAQPLQALPSFSASGLMELLQQRSQQGNPTIATQTNGQHVSLQEDQQQASGSVNVGGLLDLLRRHKQQQEETRPLNIPESQQPPIGIHSGQSAPQEQSQNQAIPQHVVDLLRQRFAQQQQQAQSLSSASLPVHESRAHAQNQQQGNPSNLLAQTLLQMLQQRQRGGGGGAGPF